MKLTLRRSVVVFSIAGIALGFSGCSKDNTQGSAASVDSEGNCTAEYISDYNKVKSQADSFNSLKSESSLDYLISDCDEFLSVHGQASCKATANGSEVVANSGLISTTCSQAHSIKANSKSAANALPIDSLAQKPKTPEKRAPQADDSLLMKELVGGKLKFIVKGANALSNMSLANYSFDGAIHSGTEYVNRGGDFSICELFRNEIKDSSGMARLGTFTDGEEIVFSPRLSTVDPYLLIVETLKLDIFCHLTNQGPISLGEMRDAMSTLFDIEVLEKPSHETAADAGVPDAGIAKPNAPDAGSADAGVAAPAKPIKKTKKK